MPRIKITTPSYDTFTFICDSDVQLSVDSSKFEQYNYYFLVRSCIDANIVFIINYGLSAEESVKISNENSDASSPI